MVELEASAKDAKAAKKKEKKVAKEKDKKKKRGKKGEEVTTTFFVVGMVFVVARFVVVFVCSLCVCVCVRVVCCLSSCSVLLFVRTMRKRMKRNIPSVQSGVVLLICALCWTVTSLR